MKNSRKKNNNSKSGFSLVEMLVATAIFMSIMTIAVSSLISIISANKKAQAIKTTIDSVTFAIDDISRDMRSGSNYQCLTDTLGGGPQSPEVNDCHIGSAKVQFINISGNRVLYEFSKDPLKPELIKTECSGTNCSGANPVELISRDSNVKIDNMNFYVIGADNESSLVQANITQPRVIITASGLISVKGSPDTSSFNLQTNVSQRIRR